MHKFALSDEERAHLDRWSENSNPALSRRARLLIETEKGFTAPEIAKILGLSTRRVHFWRGKFQSQRMGIFPETIQLADTIKTEVIITQPKDKDSLIQPRQTIGIQPSDSMADAGRKTLSFYFAVMLAHEAGTILGEDIEALHDMRVATRRMRAAWDIFGQYFKPNTSKRYKKYLQQTGRALGPVRDWDVFINKAQQDIQGLSESDQRDLQPIMLHWEQDRKVARNQMIEFLSGDIYQDFKDQFSAFLANPGRGVKSIVSNEFEGQPLPTACSVQEITPVMIFERLGVVKAYNGMIERATTVQLHALRIEIKRLHYTVNFFSEVLGLEAKLALKMIKEMQDILGELHDAEVACLLLGQVLNNWESTLTGTVLSSHNNPRALLNYLALKHQERHERLVNVPASWRKFNTHDLQLNLALAISTL